MIRLISRTRAIIGGLILALTLWAGMAGCGYHFSGGAAPGDPVREVFVAVLENDTTESGLETLVTNALIRELCREEKFRLARGGEPDVRVSGGIVSLVDENAARRSTGDSTIRRLNMTVSLEMKDAQDRTLWRDQAFSEHETYQVSPGGGLGTEAAKDQAMSILAARLAQKVRHRMEAYYEGF